jgi:uncharacterized protein (TIGR04222 family)
VNPFDLRGPYFLLFYVVLVAAVAGVAALVRRVLESGPVPRFREVDPYLVAHLRGGSSEVLRVATISLLDRGLLQISGEHIQAEPGAAARVRRPVEQAILAEFPTFLRGSSLFAYSGPLAACAPFEDELRKLRLMPSTSQILLRVLIGLGAVAILLWVAQHKIELALARGHDVVFLVALAFVSPVAIILALHSRTTTVGQRMLQDFRTLFSRLRERAGEIPPGGATNELALLAAVFGLDALRGVASMHARALFGKRLFDERRGRRKTDPNDSSGSSCGSTSTSSCGSSSDYSGGSSGDSSGGGGCGGCGGGGGGD